KGAQGIIADLMQYSGNANIELMCGKLKNLYQLREIQNIGQKMQSESGGSDAQAKELLESFSSSIFDLLEDESRNNTYDTKSIVSDALTRLLEIQEVEDGVTGIASGLDLDNITAGFQDSTMNIIAARPSMGKTALALNISTHTDKTVGIMSLETSYRSIGQRLIISEDKVDGHKALRGKLNDSEIQKIQEASERLMEKGIIVDDSTSVTAENIRIKAKAMSVQHGIDMLIVDFLQLMDGKGENENQ